MMVGIEVLSLLTSSAVFLALVLFYINQSRKNENLTKQLEDIKNTQDQIIEIEEKVFSDEESIHEFEEDLSDLSERLFHIIKTKYNLDATTYDEIIDALENIETDDEKTKKSLKDLFEYIVELEYSNNKISEEQKAIVRQAAFQLIRTVAPRLRSQAQDIGKE